MGLLDFILGRRGSKNDAVACLESGISKAKGDDLAGALKDLNKAIKINPKLAEAYCYRGIVKAVKGKRPEAIADFDKAIAIKPDYDDAYSFRAQVKEDGGDAQGARADRRRCYELRKKMKNC